MRAMHGPPMGIARDRQLLGIRLLRWVSVRRWAKMVAALRREALSAAAVIGKGAHASIRVNRHLGRGSSALHLM